MTTPSPEELLSAYAAGDVTDAERQAVEDYLRENPAAAAEMDGIRSMLARVRDNPPEPASEPDWARMSVAINEEVDQSLGQSVGQSLGQSLGQSVRHSETPVGLAARARAWLASLWQPRYVIGALAVGAAAALIVALAGGWPGSDSRPGPGVATDDIRAPGELPGDELDERQLDEFERELDQALQEALAEFDGDGQSDDDELVDALFEAIDPDAVAAEADVELAAIADGDAFPDDLVAELLGAGDGANDMDGDLDPGDYEGVNPDSHDGWLDELSDQELERLDVMLGEMMAG